MVILIGTEWEPLASASRKKTLIGLVVMLLVMALAPLAFGQHTRGEQRQSSEFGNQAEALFQNALLLVDTKAWESARLRMQEAMSLWIKGHETEKAAKAALLMGDAYKQAQNYLASLQCYELALEVKPLSGSANADAYNSIAQVYAELYERHLAKDYFTRAMTLARRIKDVSAEALALAGLAALDFRAGERSQALARITQARHLNQQLGNEIAEAALLQLAGQIFWPGRIRLAKLPNKTENSAAAWLKAIALGFR